MNELLDKDDFLGLAHLLPEGAKDLVRLIGFEPTFLLIKHHGGTHFPVGQNYNKHGKALFAALAEVIGEASAEKITLTFATKRHFFVPKCQALMTELRRRKVRAEFDELTKDQPAYMAVKDLARKYDLVESTIWYILKSIDVETITDISQMDLFSK